jgi:hypothetical protein
VHDSSGDESDATQRNSRSRSEQKKPAKKHGTHPSVSLSFMPPICLSPGPWRQTESHYQTGYVVFGFAATSGALNVHSSADRRRQKRRSTSPWPDVMGKDGLLADINVQPIVQPGIQTNPSADVLHFSGKKFPKPGKDGGGDKLHRTCTICK